MANKPKEDREPRGAGPKFRKPVIPPDFKIRRPSSPMGEILKDAERGLPESPLANDFAPHPSPSPAHPQPTPSPVLPIAPERDFNRRANSIEREAVPSGIFPGGSKKLYDSLYLRTRGAIVPVRAIQAKKRELMHWAGIKNEKTIEAHLRHLMTVGLIIRTGIVGDNEGYTYEVLLPEEAGAPHPSPSPAHPQPTPGQKLGLGRGQKLPPGGLGEPIDNKDTYGFHHTSFNTRTENDDDEALARMNAKLKEAAREVTGKETSVAESIRWEEVADVLITELKIAAARTSVSSAPAFLAEHLRRRLWKVDKKPSRETPSQQAQDTSIPVEQAKACPDCGGTGFYYPTGYEGGVAKCRHERLVTSTQTPPEQG